MALNYDNFFNNIKRKNKEYFRTNPNEPAMTLNMKKSNEVINNSYFSTFNKQRKKRLINFFKPPISNSINFNVNKTQDIIGYNNYIINGNNFNNISFNEPMKKNSFNYNLKNNLNAGLSNYLKISKFNTADKNLKNNNNTFSYINTSNTSNYNNDIEYMNMKLNFKILEQKISHLNSIVKHNNRYINKTFNESNNDSFFKNEYSLKEHKSNDYDNHKLKKYLKMKNNESYGDKQYKKKEKLLYNLKNNNFDNNKSINLKNEQKDSKIINKIYKRKLFPENEDYKESENLSEIASDLINIINNKEKNNFDIKQNNKNAKEIIKMKIIKNNKKKLKRKNKKIYNNSTDFTKFNINKTEYTVSNLPHIIYNPDKKIKNKKNSELIIEHIFSYNHHDTYDKNIKLNNLENNLNRNKSNNNEGKINIIDNNNDNEEKDDDDEEGEKIINSILAQASKNRQIKENDESKNNVISNNSTVLGKKKVSFDENLIFINYDQNNKITNLNITDSNEKPIKFKSKDIYKYLKNIKSNYYKNKLKPIILNSNIIDSDNIIIKDTNEKKTNSKNNQKRNITKRNIDFIKIVQKRGNVYNVSKEKKVKKLEYKNCKKFSEKPQNFFTEDLCDNVLLSYNLKPKNNSRNSSSEKKSGKNINKK